jgi:hypothetical protein
LARVAHGRAWYALVGAEHLDVSAAAFVVHQLQRLVWCSVTARQVALVLDSAGILAPNSSKEAFQVRCAHISIAFPKL